MLVSSTLIVRTEMSKVAIMKVNRYGLNIVLVIVCVAQCLGVPIPLSEELRTWASGTSNEIRRTSDIKVVSLAYATRFPAPGGLSVLCSDDTA